MQQPRNNYLLFAGIGAAAGGLLHIGAIFGGPTWYWMIGATKPIVRLVEQGHSFPMVIVLVAAFILFACAGYAFSGAGIIRKLPLLRTGLVAISCGLLAHGLVFAPMAAIAPEAMLGLYDGEGIDGPLIGNTIYCLTVGVCYALGTRSAWRGLSVKSMRLRSV